MPRVHVSVGSNLERERWTRRAVALLRERFGRLRISPVYESAAVGFEGDPFYNLVAGFDTALTPAEVAAALRDIEACCGRDPSSRRFAPRKLDLDFILYGALVERGADYRLPRPELLEYAFMLGPLADIAPDEQHPLDGRTYAQLWAAFDRDAAPIRPVELALAEPA